MAILDPVLPAQPASLGVKSSGLGRATAGEILGVAPTVPGSFEGLRARVAGSAASLCSPNLGHALDWHYDTRDLPPDIHNYKQHRLHRLALCESREPQRIARWGYMSNLLSPRTRPCV